MTQKHNTHRHTASPSSTHARRLKPLSLLLGLSLAAWGMQAAHAADSEPVLLTTPEGVRVEGFRITPNFSVTESWNDNIYGTPTLEKDDLITTLAASVKANSDWARHRLNLDAGVSADYYADYDSEDATDWWLGADGRYDLSAKSHALGGLRFNQGHEDRSSPDSATGATDPTTYLTSRAHLGFAHQLAPFTIRLGAVVETLDFDQYSLGTRFSYQLNANREVFFQAATDAREYDVNTVGRDSDGYRLGLGLRIKQGADFEAEGFLGHLIQDYDDIALKDVSALYYGANLKWNPATHTRVTASLDRSVNETTFTGASSHLDTTVNGRIDHDLSSRFNLNAVLSYAKSDYQGVSLELDEWVAGLGARYYFNRRFLLSAGYRYITRDADISTYEYDRNRFFLTLGYEPR
jgi:hypothetical protein